MRRAAATSSSLILILCMALALTMAALAEDSAIKVMVEPEGCGSVTLTPPEPEPGVYVNASASPAPGCRFVMWRSNIQEVNGSISNPLYFYARPNTTLVAVFMRLGEGEANASGYVFVVVKANISILAPYVKLVPRGSSTLVSVPTEIPVNDYERWVFTGWGGDVDAITGLRDSPLVNVHADREVTLIATYTLYRRFLDLWYPISEFVEVEAPVRQISDEVRAVPAQIKMRVLNETFPITTKVPKDLLPYIEVVYDEQYRVRVVALVDEPVKVAVGDIVGLSFKERPLDYWAPRGSILRVVALEEEAGEYWLSPDHRSMTIQVTSPKTLVILYERKPHAWMSGLPLYPLVNNIAFSLRGTGLWPVASVILSDPIKFYVVFGGLIALIGGACYACYVGIRRGVRAIAVGERGRPAREVRILKALRPTLSVSTIPREAAPPPSYENPLVSLLLDIARSSLAAPISEGPARQAERAASANEGLDFAQLDRVLSGERGSVPARLVIARRWTPQQYNMLRRAVEEGRLILEGEPDPYQDAVERVVEGLGGGGVCVYGDGAPARRRVAYRVAEALGRRPVILEDPPPRTLEDALRLIAGMVGESPSLLIATERVPNDYVKLLTAASGILDTPFIKLSKEPVMGLTSVEVRDLTVDDLLSAAIALAIKRNVIQHLDFSLLEEVARGAYALRGVDSLERFFGEYDPGGDAEEQVRRWIEGELRSLFTNEELLSLLLVAETRRPLSEAVRVYKNILIQLEPGANISDMVELFEDKVEKLVAMGDAFKLPGRR